MTAQPLVIPILTTKRLRMEPISMDHSKGMFDLWSDGDVCRYSGTVVDYDGRVIPTPATSRAESDRIIDFWLKAAEDGWGFRWSIFVVECDAFAGTIGFNSVAECAELAYHLLPKHWGKGLMTEAVRRAIEWRRGDGTSEIEAFIEPQNAPSIALAERIGLKPTGEFANGAQRYRMAI